MKKLSDYNRLEGFRVMGKITRILSPIASDKSFIDRLSGCFKDAQETDLNARGAVIMINILDLLLNECPDAILKIVGAINGTADEQVYDGTVFDAFDDMMELAKDKELTNFLSKRFGLGATGQLSTSTNAESTMFPKQFTTSTPAPRRTPKNTSEKSI